MRTAEITKERRKYKNLFFNISVYYFSSNSLSNSLQKSRGEFDWLHKKIL